VVLLAGFARGHDGPLDLGLGGGGLGDGGGARARLPGRVHGVQVGGADGGRGQHELDARRADLEQVVGVGFQARPHVESARCLVIFILVIFILTFEKIARIA